MTVYSITTSVNIDSLAGKAGGDTYNINGGTLTIDQDSRYGANTTTTTGSMGPINISATLGGNLEVDARFVRLIPYNGGSGTVPATGTIITDGSGSGVLICVIASLTSVPEVVGNPLPTNGYIKIKQWNSVPFTNNTSLTGVSATVNGIDIVGWISIVGDELQSITGRRLGLIRMQGADFDLGVTTGSRSTTYQIPTQGENVYLAGVQVETDVGSNEFEWYPNAGNQTALVTSVGIESVRGKVCWISTAGVLQFGHDGTNSSGGYCPVAGLKIRIPNIYLHSATTAARQTNALPHVTLTTRYDWNTTGGAQIVLSKVMMAWYFSTISAYSIQLDDVAFCDAILINELATETTFNRLCVSPTQTQANTALSLLIDQAGGTINNSRFVRWDLAIASTTCALTDIIDWTFNSCEFRILQAHRGAAGFTINGTRINNIIMNDCTMIGAAVAVGVGSNINFNNHTHIDAAAGTSTIAVPEYAIAWSNIVNATLNGFSCGNLSMMVQPVSGIISISSGSNIKVRNIGSPNAPLDLGGPRVDDVTWSRVTTTATVTSTNHGLSVGQFVYVIISSSTAAITVSIKTITAVPDANSFSFVCLNAGTTSGTLSYFPSMTSFGVVASSASFNCKIQRVYLTHNRNLTLSIDNSIKNYLFESTWGDLHLSFIQTDLNSTSRGNSINNTLAASLSTYGTHWLDFYLSEITPNVNSQSWSRSATIATITSNDHNLKTNDRIVVTATSDATAIPLGAKVITALTKDTFSFICLNAGSTSGIISFIQENGKVAIAFNEPTEETASQVTITGGNPQFTSAGNIYMPNIGDQIVYEMPYFCIGHSSFPVDELAIALSSNNYDIEYAIDTGSGFSSYKNLYYPRVGGGGSISSTNVTMTSTTGVQVGDYIFGTNIAPFARVVSIVNATTITVDTPNIGTVSGILRFNALPNEVVDPEDGFKLKIRLTTSTTNVGVITSISIWTNSTASDRALQYPLDIVPITVEVLDQSNIPISNARVGVYKLSNNEELMNVLTNANGIATGNTEYTTDTDVVIRVRKSSEGATRYLPSVSSDTLISSGLSSIVLLSPDTIVSPTTSRDDVTINWNTSPRIITVAAPSTEITIQELLDVCRELEDDADNMANPLIADASGKEYLGDGYVGITLSLQNALLAFEDRPGPDFVKCFVGGGNLLAVDGYNNLIDPIANTDYTQVKVTLSISAALLEGSGGSTPSAIADAVWDEAISEHTIPGSMAQALANAGLTPEQAKQLLLIFINSL